MHSVVSFVEVYPFSVTHYHSCMLIAVGTTGYINKSEAIISSHHLQEIPLVRYQPPIGKKWYRLIEWIYVPHLLILILDVRWCTHCASSSEGAMKLKVFALVLTLCLFFTTSLAQQRVVRVSHGTFNPPDCILIEYFMRYACMVSCGLYCNCLQ